MVCIHDADGALHSEQERAAIERAANAVFGALHIRGNADISVVSPETIREVNRKARGIDQETDVLSFPAAYNGETPLDGFYGDILINPVRARMQASEFGHGTEREFAFLTVHGLLHLFGYDHMMDKEEQEMRHMQRMIFERMGQTL